MENLVTPDRGMLHIALDNTLIGLTELSDEVEAEIVNQLAPLGVDKKNITFMQEKVSLAELGVLPEQVGLPEGTKEVVTFSVAIADVKLEDAQALVEHFTMGEGYIPVNVVRAEDRSTSR